MALASLLIPPNPKTGFPWTQQHKDLTEIRIDRTSYPKISIITPSYNQGNFIEETIRSILLQNYPNLEYIIIDGGSTDNTIQIIKKYESFLTYWISESDGGQAHAINKGLEKATGDILAYINSDDYYLPDTLFKVACFFQSHPETDLFHGKCRYVDSEGSRIGEQLSNIKKFEEIIDLWDVWWKKRQFVQPEVFWSRQIAEKVGTFNQDLHYAMDYDYWCRILKAGGIINSSEKELACFRITDTQKSNQSLKVAEELLDIVKTILWDKETQLPLKKRLTLQGKWLYQVKLLKQIEKSVKAKDHFLLRWIKSSSVIFSNPQILLSPAFKGRLLLWLFTNSSRSDKDDMIIKKRP